MLVLLSADFVYLLLRDGKADVPSTEKWAVRLLLLYLLGWFTVATVANATALLYYLNWNVLVSLIYLDVDHACGSIVIAVLSEFQRRDIATQWSFSGRWQDRLEFCIGQCVVFYVDHFGMVLLTLVMAFLIKKKSVQLIQYVLMLLI
jgi:hypothetical protein